MSEQLIPIKEAAQTLGVTYATLWQQIHDGDLKAVQFKPNGRLYLRPKDIEDWLDRKTITPK